MALDGLTAKANVGAGTDTLAGKSTAGGFVGAVLLTDDSGAEIGAANPLPVEITGSIPVTIASAIEITNDAGNPIPVSGTVSTGLSQPLTDTQLRAAAVPVSGPLTDAQLRATDVPVSVGNFPATQAVSAAALPLPTGAATEATLATLAGSVYVHNAPFVDGSPGMLILGKRRDSDSTAVADGDLNTFNMDEEGRLKVASKPASYPDITGDITAIQATIGTPVAGGTVEGDVSRASNVMVFCTGTFAGVNCTFEGSLEASGATNWFAVQAVRSNANTIELTTGALSAQPAYAWELSVNALKRFRVRATARTSGTQSWRFVQGTYATEPIPAAQVSATQPVSGTVTITNPSGTAYALNSAATTNTGVVKASAGNLISLVANNHGASAAYVKLYQKATAPVLASDVPVGVYKIEPGATFVLPLSAPGQRFNTGIAIAVTRNAADTDATAIGAGEVKVHATYI